MAKRVEQETGINAQLMLAQAALETGWGQHPIVGADGQPSHNLFGIKAHNAWHGDAVNIVTTEYREGVALKERAQFRAYGSYQESFADYADFLRQNPRYEGIFDYLHDPHAFAQALQSNGYATDPRYAAKLSNIMERIDASFALNDVSSPLADLGGVRALAGGHK